MRTGCLSEGDPQQAENGENAHEHARDSSESWFFVSAGGLEPGTVLALVLERFVVVAETTYLMLCGHNGHHLSFLETG